MANTPRCFRARSVARVAGVAWVVLCALLVLHGMRARTAAASEPSSAIASSSPPISWATVAALPSARGGVAAVAVPSGLNYAVGGRENRTAYNNPQFDPAPAAVYDTVSNSWATLARLNGPRYYPGAATGPDGRIYATGGIISDYGDGTSAVLAFAPASGTWMNVASMLHVRAAPAATGLDGTIYAIGGHPVASEKLVEAYDLASHGWTARASMTHPRGKLAAVTGADGRIYALGGDYFTTTKVCDPHADRWTTVAAMPTPRYALAAALGPEGKIYAIGGVDLNAQVSDAVDVYDTATNTWSAGPALPTARYGLGAATGADGRIYAIGGFTRIGDFGSAVSVVEALSVLPPSPTATMTVQLTAMTTPSPTFTATPSLPAMATATATVTATQVPTVPTTPSMTLTPYDDRRSECVTDSHHCDDSDGHVVRHSRRHRHDPGVHRVEFGELRGRSLRPRHRIGARDARGAYDIVFGFDPSQGGVTSYFRDPNTSVLNNLATLERRQGYWLHITGTTGIDWPAR